MKYGSEKYRRKVSREANVKSRSAYRWKTNLSRHASRLPMKNTKVKHITHVKINKWFIEEGGIDSKGKEYWNMLSEEFTCYDRAMIELQYCKWQFPYLNYRIVQYEDVLFRKLTITMRT